MIYHTGIDPDMHHMPVVVLHPDGYVVDIQIIKAGNKGRPALVEMARAVGKYTPYTWKGLPSFTVAIEAQEIYQFGAAKTQNAQSIMFLATAAGMALSRFAQFAEVTYFPTPQEWKGNVPKRIHQARVLKRLGWEYVQTGGEDGYCVPLNPPKQFSHIKKSEWKHVADAIGLAFYAKDRHEQETKIKQFRSGDIGQTTPSNPPARQTKGTGRHTTA